MEYREKMSWYNRNYKNIYTDFEPKSFWEFKRKSILDDKINDIVAQETLKEDLQTKRDSLTYNKSWGARTALSKFNTEYGRKIIEFYTCQNDKILDPFSGRTRMEICNVLKRNYTGFEINTEYSRDGIINDDCLNIDNHHLDKDFDFLFTCPPYWSMELYSKDKPIDGDLSMIKTYNEFKKEYEKRLIKTTEYVKDTGLAAIVVANFRRNGEFISLEYDTIDIYKRMGWKIYDIVILEMNPAARQPYYSQAITKRRMLTTHEYLLIFHKNTDIDERKMEEDMRNYKDEENDFF